MDLKEIEQFDAQKMYKVYDDWPKMALNAFNFSHEKINYPEINHIVFAGMGGSGTIGDIFAAILSKTNIHVTNVKGYLLPKTVDLNTLVIATSISGNTNETLTVLESAAKLDCKVLAISSGGKMEEFCLNNNIEYRKIKKIHSSRASLVNFLYSIINILDLILPIGKLEVEESIREMRALQKIISTENLNEDNTSLNLANWISGISVIYYPFGLQSAAIRFKNSLQENSKSHAFAEDVIEACHNGIVSWEKESNCHPILLEGIDDFIKTKERWIILKEFLKEERIKFYEITSVNGGILSKIINLIYVLDFASIYLAIILKLDPTPVKSIDYIKKKM